MNKRLRGSLLLLLAAIIWGSSFVAQDAGAPFVQPFTFNGVRWLIGAFFLAPFMLFGSKNKTEPKEHTPIFNKSELIGGLLCGTLLFFSSYLQQLGISLYGEGEAAAGKSGFITALYIILVPVFGLFAKKKVPATLWLSIIVALVGMYMLCITENLTLSKADFFVFLCAISFTLHILTVDKFSVGTSSIKFSVIQMFVCGILSSACMFIFENPCLDDILKAAIPILYAAIFSSGIAYTLQIVGQKNTDPTVASILMSLESVFAALTGALFGERMSQKEVLGCVLMFVAVLLAQIDFKAIIKMRKDVK